MKQYVLKAESREGTIYYMNVIMVTSQKQYAKKYSESELEVAKKDLEHFKMMFCRADSIHDYEIVEF